MKKIFTLCALFCLAEGFSQSFHKNALVIDVNAGLEIYNTKLNVHDNTTGKDTLQNDKTGNTHFTLGAEYGLHKNFGVGLRYKGGNYFVGTDSTGAKEGTVKGNEFLVQLNYHPVSTQGFDLILGADGGFSKLKYNINDKEQTKITGSGSFFSLYVNPRVYIGRFGFNAKLYLPFYSYPKLVTNNEELNKQQSFKLSGIPGFGFNIGIHFRFMSEKDAAKNEEKKKDEEKK